MILWSSLGESRDWEDFKACLKFNKLIFPSYEILTKESANMTIASTENLGKTNKVKLLVPLLELWKIIDKEL